VSSLLATPKHGEGGRLERIGTQHRHYNPDLASDFFIRPQSSTVIVHTLATLAKLLHKQDFRDGL